MNINRLTSLLVYLAVALTLSGCSRGTKMLKVPVAQPEQSLLSKANDNQLEARLDWVIVRNGPGTWAARADWDEYLLQLSNLSDESLSINSIALTDSLGTTVPQGINRARLVRDSKKTAKRYKNENIQIQAGLTGFGMLGAGSALFVTGGYLALGTAYGLIGTSVGAVVVPAALAVALAGPVYMAGSLVRGYNNTVVDYEINERQTLTPFEIAQKSTQSISVFFPISPSPTQIEISYEDSQGSNLMVIDTNEALKGLHLTTLPGSAMPAPTN